MSRTYLVLFFKSWSIYIRHKKDSKSKRDTKNINNLFNVNISGKVRKVFSVYFSEIEILMLFIILTFQVLFWTFWSSQEKLKRHYKLVISISRNGLLKSYARFVIERSEIRKKQHDFKSVHFECRMVLFYMIWEKSRLQSTFFPIE